MNRVQSQNVNLLTGVDLASSQSSSAFSIRQTAGYSIQHIFSAGSASRSAVLTLSACPTEDGVFTAIDTFQIDGTSGSRVINVENPNYSFVKVSASPLVSSGGTLTTSITTFTYSS